MRLISSIALEGLNVIKINGKKTKKMFNENKDGKDIMITSLMTEVSLQHHIYPCGYRNAVHFERVYLGCSKQGKILYNTPGCVKNPSNPLLGTNSVWK